MKSMAKGQSKKDGKDQETIQSSTPPDPGYHMENNKDTINITNKSQDVSNNAIEQSPIDKLTMTTNNVTAIEIY